jgi:hypothetical protein
MELVIVSECADPQCNRPLNLTLDEFGPIIDRARALLEDNKNMLTCAHPDTGWDGEVQQLPGHDDVWLVDVDDWGA